MKAAWAGLIARQDRQRLVKLGAEPFPYLTPGELSAIGVARGFDTPQEQQQFT